jgi:AraC-like DNA-binding protein
VALASNYLERAPLPSLASVVACTWRRLHLPTDGGSVVPDGCMDILWRVDGGLSVAGPDTTPYAVRPREPVRYVGLRFKPGVAPAVLGIDASEVRDQRVDLADVWPASAVERLNDQLLSAPEEAEQALQDAVLQRLRAGAVPDALVQALIAAFEEPRGGVSQAAAMLGVSERQLRRRCEVAVGYGPKTLERILRFQRAQRMLDASRGTLAHVAIECGYADQAHLTREFLRLAGATPGQIRRVVAAERASRRRLAA